MANTDIVQVIAETRVDARSLSEFVFKPASFMVQRRLAPPINTLQFYIDRFNDIATSASREISEAIKTSILSSGFITVDSFELGATITQRNQALRHAATGKLYRWAGNLPKVVAVGSTPTSTGGTGANAWLEVSDAALRQELVGNPADGLGAALINGTVLRVTSIEDMKTYSAPVGYVFNLNDNGRSGIFDVLAGNFSAELAADTFNGIYVGLSDNPTATEKVAKRRYGSGINVSWFGVTGSGNESDRIISATNMGDTILFDKGSYIAEGLPIRTGLYYKALAGDVTINLPENPSDHMFKTTGEDDVITSGGISGIRLSGGRTLVYNGLDFSSIFHKSLVYWVAEEVWITGFNRGYNGTDNDRMPVFRQCRFDSNVIGAYGGEHPLFVACDFRANDVGLTGRLNDFKCVDSKFAYNRIGVQANEETGLGMTASRLTGCQFYKNTETAVEMGSNSSVISCEIDGNGAGSNCVVLKTGFGNTVSDCRFNQGTLSSDTCISFPMRMAGIDPRGSVFSGNVFMSAEVSAINLDESVSFYSITSNTYSDCKSFITSKPNYSSSVIQGNAGTTTEGSVIIDKASQVSITGNSFQTLSVTDPIITFTRVDASLGNIITSNIFDKRGTGKGKVFGGSMARCSFTSNRLTNIELGLSGITSMIGAYINGNQGLSTYQPLNLTVASTETSATVGFSLDFDIDFRDIKLIPLKNSSSLANAHVSSIDNVARTFTVTLQEPAGFNCIFAIEINKNNF